MDSIHDNVEDLVTHVTDYLDTQKQLIVLNLAEKSTTVASKSASWLFIGLLFTFAMLFLSVALGFYLSALTGSATTGFLCIGGFYGLLSLVVWLARKSLIEDKVSDSILSIYFDENE